MQRQDSTYDQLRTVYDLANKAGCYDAADLIKTALIDPTTKKLQASDVETQPEVKISAPFKYFADKYGWDGVCDVLGWDVYWAKDGKGDSDEVVSLTQTQIDKLEGR